MKKVRNILIGAAIAGFATIMLPGSAQAAQGYDRCAKGDVCVFTEYNGMGRMCAWYGDDPDWWGGSVQCSWADDTAVRSVYNNGYSGSYDDVRMYTGSGYTGYVGCLGNGVKGNLSSPIKMRSHYWVTNAC